MSRYACGYVPDSPGHKRTPFHHLAARLAVAAAFSASLEASMSAPLNQRQTGACTGHSVAEGVFTACAVAGTPLPWMPSPKGVYTVGRCVDRTPNADGSLPPLADEGAQPNQVVRGVNEWGVHEIGRSPDGDLGDADAPSINEEPTLDELEKDAEEIFVGDYGIYSSGAQRGADVRQAITNGIPVAVAVPGGSSAWQDYAGGIIGATGQELDHYVLLYGYEKQPDGTYVYFIRNSWGDWGESGNCRVNEAALAEFDNLIALSVRRAT